MSDKTRLEFDLEHRERFRTPASVKTLIYLLLIAVCVIGVYALQLKKELAVIQQDAGVMKEAFTREKLELLTQIKQLQARGESPEPADSVPDPLQ